MKKIFQSLKVILLAIVLSFGISYVFAWTAPTVAPTGGNSTAPLNTSATSQSKNGTLVLPRTDGVQGIETYGTALFATLGGRVGIGTTTPWAKLTVEVPNLSSITTDLSIGNRSFDSSTVVFTNSYGTPQARIKTIGEGQDSTNFEIKTFGQDNWVAMQRRFYVDWDGTISMPPDVAIGKLTPTEKLDVAGNIKASGTICGSGGCIGSGAFQLAKSPTAPVVCDNSNAGAMYFDTQVTGAWQVPCVCMYKADIATWRWAPTDSWLAVCD